MRRRRLAACFVALWLFIGPRPSSAGEEFHPPSPEAIKAAVSRGAEWIRVTQGENGSWGSCESDGVYGGERSIVPRDGYPIGPTAFAIFALVKSGVGRDDPAIRRGVRWLNNNAPQRPGDGKFRRCSSYESAAFILALTSLYGPAHELGKAPVWATLSENPRHRPEDSEFPQADWTWMHYHIEHLLACRSSFGCWGYYARNDGYQDISATQFALLALREAVRAGYPIHRVAPDLWKRAAQSLCRFQVANGAFKYHEGETWSSGRTVAGVSSLLICREQLRRAKQRVPEGVDDAIAGGLAFLDKAFDVERNRDSKREEGQYHYCHLYGIERVGALSGRREFGGKAWHARGAAFLLEQQRSGGNWVDPTCMRPRDLLGTCFALLFLSRATTPVTASK